MYVSMYDSFSVLKQKRTMLHSMKLHYKNHMNLCNDFLPIGLSSLSLAQIWGRRSWSMPLHTSRSAVGLDRRGLLCLCFKTKQPSKDIWRLPFLMCLQWLCSVFKPASNDFASLGFVGCLLWYNIKSNDFEVWVPSKRPVQPSRRIMRCLERFLSFLKDIWTMSSSCLAREALLACVFHEVKLVPARTYFQNPLSFGNDMISHFMFGKFLTTS